MPHSDRRSAADGHILIGGTGRAGTTLLVQYFTVLGFDTGFKADDMLERVDPISHGGLEQPVHRVLRKGRQMPYVAKSPGFGRNLVEFLDSGNLKVKHCIIPVRELGEAAESRREVMREAAKRGKGPDDKQRGGIIGRRHKNPEKMQERLLAEQFYRFLHTMLMYDVPVHFLRFPDFAQGKQDLFTALRPIMEEHGVTHEESNGALAQVLKPELIHDFSGSRLKL